MRIEGSAGKRDFDHRLLKSCKFAVIDPSMLAYLPPGVDAEPIVPSVLIGSKHLMPALLELRALTATQTSLLLQAVDDADAFERPPPMAVLIATEVDAKSYAAHWNSLHLCKTFSMPPSWLRVHDSRVLHQMLRILSPPPKAP